MFSLTDIPDKTQQAIFAELPPFVDMQREICSFPDPDLISMASPRDESVTVAEVCLADAIGRACLIRLSLFFAKCAVHYYRERKKEIEAVFWSRYYSDYAALCFYPAAEDMAEFLISFLHIPREKLPKAKGHCTSTACRVGNYLDDNMKSHPFTAVINDLHGHKEWAAMMDYRRKWVHEQPPHMEGEGIVYKRQSRWKVLPDGERRLEIGAGEKPESKIDKIIERGISSAWKLYNVLKYFSDEFEKRLHEIGIQKNPKGQWTMFL
jgi:hypothetical protein